jgi:signal transduction histidine kinase
MIPKKAEVNIFRIIQELVTNSIKHSEAKEINVQISCHEKNIQVTVEDDGIGYLTDENSSTGIGLTNINSRVGYLLATIDVVSNNQGTSTTIEIDTTKLNDN